MLTSTKYNPFSNVQPLSNKRIKTILQKNDCIIGYLCSMQSQVYPNHLTIHAALQTYFAKYHFADGGYNDAYFKIKLGPVFIPLPNTKARVAAVKFHDIHHILTEYPATWKGEVQIAAWELAAGCGRFFAAWFLNFGSLGIGLLLYPKTLFKAFMMGRHVKTNLYNGYAYNESLLSKTVGEMRHELNIGYAKKNSMVDLTHFFLWILLLLVIVAAEVWLLCLIIPVCLR